MEQTVTTLANGIDWITSHKLVPYEDAQIWMEQRARDVADGQARECVWLLEHPPLYTAGTSAAVGEILNPVFPVFKTGRGGRYTYHGPGQRIGYIVLDIGKRGHDVRCFVRAIEGWLINALGQLGIAARRAEGRIGIWVDDPGQGEAKIGAIGIRVRRWVSLHGFAINVAPNLSHFEEIIPCGISEFGVTSLSKLGINADFNMVDAALQAEFATFLTELNPS